MNKRNASGVALRTLIGLVLAVSGVYLIVYLYRWEWNRAVISGIFFVAAELVAVAAMLFSRLARLEDRVGAGGAPPSPTDISLPIEADVDIDRESPFAWLDPASGRLGVFVPLLMGAGVIFSAIALVVEKISGAVAQSRGTARTAVVTGLALPAGGLVGPVGTEGRDGAPKAPHSPAVRAVVALASGLMVFFAIGLVADATQARPDPHPDRSTIEVDVRVRDARESAVEEAGALWVACLGRAQLEDASVTADGPGRSRLVLTGLMGEHTRLRITGCLADATLDGVRATVVRISGTPADALPPA
jgi:hypothetical protein